MRHELLSILAALFAWPAGIVLGNLVANLFWLPLQWLGLHFKLKSMHGLTHDKLDAILMLLDACPDCGHRRSEADLLPTMPAPSIVVSSKHTEA